MKNTYMRLVARAVAATYLLTIFAPIAQAAPLAIPDVPLFTLASVPPMVMLDVTKDHQLYYKAYNDYSDLDGDGAVETTYKHSFDYYGYFDSTKCYTYSTANSRFEPAAVTANKYCTGQWAGNFLNWLSMSRMDIVRKVLYGGTRSTDTAALTVLERAFLPTEAHSWAKYYNGADIAQLTPFAAIPTTATTAVSVNAASIAVPTAGFPAAVTFNKPAGMSFEIGDQILAVRSNNGAADTANQMTGVVTATAASTFTISVDSDGRTGNQNSKNWFITNYTPQGISFCNTTWAAAAENSTTTTSPPLIRVAQGNYTLWGANERWQCYWASEKSNTQSGFSGGMRSNGNRLQRSGMGASAENAPTARGLLPGGGFGQADYVARVVACNSALIGNENCSTYGSSVKPAGLLQKYGEGTNPKIKFGLMTGSYAKNVSGGVLRKNIGGISDEVNANGTLNATVGIMKTLDRMRLYGYEYNGGTYIGGAANVDNCTYQQIGIVPAGGAVAGGQPATEGNCASWGNPMSEIFTESLRYFAGKSANAAFTYGGGSKDASLGLPLATWTDPIKKDTLQPQNDNFCSPMNIVAFNASVSSYDNDQMGGFADLGGVKTAAGYTTDVGAAEGINGKTVLIGNNGVTSDGACTPKALADLGTGTGICPEAPSLSGSYQMAGAALYAHTNRIRTSPTLLASDKTSYKVKTYGIGLSTAVPKINLKVGTNDVTLQPAYRLDRTDVAAGRYGTGTIVDFRVIDRAADGSSGTYYVNWEDSNQGGDYDQDVIGILKYQVVDATRVDVTTRIISASTANPQGFGYSISGTTKDGAHFHSGIYNFSYTDPQNITMVGAPPNVNVSGGCNGCSDDSANVARTARYTVGANTITPLQDPLYYAAKFGGFEDANSNNLPDQKPEWDSKLPDGTPIAGGDGLPDTYFFVNNPGSLEKSLDSAFSAATQDTSGSAVATNSTALRTGAAIYQARFNPVNWTGELIANSINTDGEISATPLWNAGDKLNETNKPAPNSRVIVTYDPSVSTGGGKPFRWASLNLTQQGQLKIAGEPNTVNAQDRVDWLRGSSAREGNSTNDFRVRLLSKLGDIVDSSPAYVAAPAGRYNGDATFFAAFDEGEFFSFRTSKKNRTPMVYIGANDGMLHAFDAATGVEKFAYIPNAVFPNLASLTLQNYQHRFFVDGTPKVNDAKIKIDSNAPQWRTLLAGGLNKGGKGIYLLDVTDPASFSESNASSIGLWEFTDLDDADLGYTYGRPEILKMNNGKWAVVFGNGYNSTNGHAMLFVTFIEQGLDHQWTINSDYVKIDTGFGDASNVNGLSAVAAIDIDLNGTADYIYAGDLKGNLWKFDLRSANPASWGVAQTAGSKVPLFVACVTSGSACAASDRQPITSAPELTFHPENLDSQFVFFGTGKYLESNDQLSSQVQTVYGVWDDNPSTIFSQAVHMRSELQQQTITTNAAKTQRTVSTTPVDWTIKKGWYEDLPTTGERLMGTPLLINGTFFYSTFIPSLSPCDFGGDGFLMGVDFKNGGQVSFRVFDSNGDNKIDKDDSLLGGINVGAALGGATFIAPGERGKDGVAITIATKPLVGGTTGGGTAGSTGQSWRVGWQVWLGKRISWRELTPQ